MRLTKHSSICTNGVQSYELCRLWSHEQNNITLKSYTCSLSYFSSRHSFPKLSRLHLLQQGIYLQCDILFIVAWQKTHNSSDCSPVAQIFKFLVGDMDKNITQNIKSPAIWELRPHEAHTHLAFFIMCKRYCKIKKVVTAKLYN